MPQTRETIDIINSIEKAVEFYEKHFRFFTFGIMRPDLFESQILNLDRENPDKEAQSLSKEFNSFFEGNHLKLLQTPAAENYTKPILVKQLKKEYLKALVDLSKGNREGLKYFFSKNPAFFELIKENSGMIERIVNDWNNKKYKQKKKLKIDTQENYKMIMEFDLNDYLEKNFSNQDSMALKIIDKASPSLAAKIEEMRTMGQTSPFFKVTIEKLKEQINNIIENILRIIHKNMVIENTDEKNLDLLTQIINQLPLELLATEPEEFPDQTEENINDNFNFIINFADDLILREINLQSQQEEILKNIKDAVITSKALSFATQPEEFQQKFVELIAIKVKEYKAKQKSVTSHIHTSSLFSDEPKYLKLLPLPLSKQKKQINKTIESDHHIKSLLNYMMEKSNEKSNSAIKKQIEVFIVDILKACRHQDTHTQITNAYHRFLKSIPFANLSSINNNNLKEFLENLKVKTRQPFRGVG